jgi:predicted ABC-type ATPase
MFTERPEKCTTARAGMCSRSASRGGLLIEGRSGEGHTCGMPRPIVHVIAGPNGAGKTTFARVFLAGAPGGESFLNADLLAAGLSPLAPGTMELRAGRLLLERWHELASTRANFAFETTMSGRTYGRMLWRLKDQGYEIRMAYLWLDSSDLSLRRIRQRVRKGGHNVLPEIVLRRHLPGIRNFLHFYLSLADEALLFDASGERPILIARFVGEKSVVFDPPLYERIQKESCG